MKKQNQYGSFLFLGSSGVGKTELSKKLNKELFETEDSIIRFDMSEYMEQNSVSKLIRLSSSDILDMKKVESLQKQLEEKIIL